LIGRRISSRATLFAQRRLGRTWLNDGVLFYCRENGHPSSEQRDGQARAVQFDGPMPMVVYTTIASTEWRAAMIVSRPTVAPLIACLFAVLTAPLAAQAPAAPPITVVLVSLTVKQDIDRLQITKVMPDEVRETVKVYLDGKIQQWYARGDGRGVVFILNATTLADAKAVMESLPLWKAGFVNLEYTALGPLTPLRALIAPPGAGQSK
jgi:hypothetical protein